MPTSHSLDPELLHRFRDSIESHLDEGVQHLRDLVAIRSVNPQFAGVDPSLYLGQERRCVEHLAGMFSTLGMTTELVEAEAGRPNLVATRGAESSGGRSLAFNGHVDTVAPIRESSWDIADPWDLQREGAECIGLGACDMKGSFVAMWLAIRALQDTGTRLRGDLQIHAVVGEETMSHEAGTTAVLRAGHVPDGVIVGEPTGGPDGLLVNHTAAGNLNFRIDVEGKATHWGNRALAIRPGMGIDPIGVNAIDKLQAVMASLRALEDRWALEKSDEAFPDGFFIIHPGVLHSDIGIPAPAYFPDQGYVHYLLWYPPREAPEDIRAEVAEAVNSLAEHDPWLRSHPPTIEWLGNWPAAHTPIDSSLVRTVTAARNAAANLSDGPPQPGGRAFGAASDASFYEQFGVPAVVCGPGDIRVAHSVNERVSVPDLAQAALIYAAAALAWCESN